MMISFPNIWGDKVLKGDHAWIAAKFSSSLTRGLLRIYGTDKLEGCYVPA